MKQELVPELRFPAFENAEGWSSPQLGEISDRITKKVGDRKLTTVSITAGKGFVSQAEKFSRDISGKQYKNYIVLKAGEFSYNKGNSKTFQQGAVYRLKEFEEVAAPNAFISFRFKTGYVPDFYKGYFDNNYHGRQILKFITSGARSDGLLNIRPDDFFSIILPTPVDREEQQKIADCLSSLDELITAHIQKHQALQSYKKGLVQNLFPSEGESVPTLRFPEFWDTGEWVLYSLGEKVKLLSGFPFKSQDISGDPSGIPLMRGINITEGFIRHSPKIDRFFLGDAVPLEKYRLNVNDLIIGMDGSKVGKNSAIVTEKDAGSLLIQRVARLRSKRESTIQFIFQHIHSRKFHSYVDRINTSSGIPHISAKQINEFEICFPPVGGEQQKIAECLSSVDDLIAAQAQKIEELKAHKKGLMQQLFPKIDGE
ncbi:MAG: restriction endonuclease subunit S [Marinomonas foliarum]|nr:restriction endonuclease subunit S [Marinomonas foliarum]